MNAYRGQVQIHVLRTSMLMALPSASRFRHISGIFRWRCDCNHHALTCNTCQLLFTHELAPAREQWRLPFSFKLPITKGMSRGIFILHAYKRIKGRYYHPTVVGRSNETVYSSRPELLFVIYSNAFKAFRYFRQQSVQQRRGQPAFRRYSATRHNITHHSRLHLALLGKQLLTRLFSHR